MIVQLFHRQLVHCPTISVLLFHHFCSPNPPFLFHCSNITRPTDALIRCSTIAPSDVPLFHHLRSTVPPSDVPLLQHQTFYCSSIRRYTVPPSLLHCSTITCSTVPPFHHLSSSLPLSDVLLFHHDCLTVPPSDVPLLHNETFYCFSIRCSTISVPLFHH